MSDYYGVNAFTYFFCICQSFTRQRRNPKGPLRPRCCRTTYMKTMQMFALNSPAAVRDFLCQISVQIRTKFRNSSLPRWPKGFREPCPHVCHQLILQASQKCDAEEGKENTDYQNQNKDFATESRRWAVVKVLGNDFFSLLFFNKCGKHDSVANCKLNTRSAAAVIDSSILIGPVRKQLW